MEILPQYPAAPYALQHWYGYGLVAIGGHLYHFLCYLDHGQWHGVGTAPAHFRGARVVQALDRETWRFADDTLLDSPVHAEDIALRLKRAPVRRNEP